MPDVPPPTTCRSHMHPLNLDDPFTFTLYPCPHHFLVNSNELVGARRRSSYLGVQLDVALPHVLDSFQLRFVRAIWNSQRSAIERHGVGKCKPQVPFRWGNQSEQGLQLDSLHLVA